MLTIAVLMYGLFVAVVVAICTWVLCRFHFYQRQVDKSKAEGHQAFEALTRLHALATRVAVDVDEHSNQVEAISDSLTAAAHPEPTVVVDAVAQLIEANQQMQDKLDSTEYKLREQAQQIEVHAAEARTDPLTLLANRRAFADELTRRIDEFRRQGRVFSVIMADVDHFKAFNDSYGHQTGDEVLRGVARAVRRKMREMDLVARYGGEEFSIILPGTPLADACKAASRAQEAVRKFRLAHSGKELKITASFGVAEVRTGEDSTRLLDRTDTALYASKQAGRDCIHWHDGETIRRVVSERGAASGLAADKAPIKHSPVEHETCKTSRAAPDDHLIAHGDVSEGARGLELFDGLPNRSMFCQHVRNRLAEWNRGGPVFSLLLAEVRQENQEAEECDHQGEEIPMKAAVRLVTAAVREMDVVGTYAPDCLAVLLPSAALADAIQVAERLREGVLLCSDSAGRNQPRLALCAGAVQVHEGDDFVALLKRGEEALDAADRAGGNRTYCHDGEHCVPVSAILETMDCGT